MQTHTGNELSEYEERKWGRRDRNRDWWLLCIFIRLISCFLTFFISKLLTDTYSRHLCFLLCLDQCTTGIVVFSIDPAVLTVQMLILEWWFTKLCMITKTLLQGWSNVWLTFKESSLRGSGSGRPAATSCTRFSLKTNPSNTHTRTHKCIHTCTVTLLYVKHIAWHQNPCEIQSQSTFVGIHYFTFLGF